jgi:hypothetical protein
MKFLIRIHLAAFLFSLQLPVHAAVTAAMPNPEAAQLPVRENQETKTSTVVSTTLGGIRVFPNPWRADQHSDRTITFDRLPVNSTIKIFTLSGHEVRTLSADNGSASWDRTNDSGDKVASGIYLYLATDNQGNQSRGKLAIIK